MAVRQSSLEFHRCLEDPRELVDYERHRREYSEYWVWAARAVPVEVHRYLDLSCYRLEYCWTPRNREEPGEVHVRMHPGELVSWLVLVVVVVAIETLLKDDG